MGEEINAVIQPEDDRDLIWGLASEIHAQRSL